MRVLNSFLAATGLLFVASTAEAQIAAAKQAPSNNIFADPKSVIELDRMKMRLYEFDQQFVGPVRTTQKGLFDAALGMFCSWTEVARLNRMNRPEDVTIKSAVCRKFAEPASWKNAAKQDFKLGTEGIAFEKGDYAPGVHVNVAYRSFGSWSELMVRQLNSKKHEVCTEFKSYTEDGSMNPEIRKENQIKICATLANEDFKKLRTELLALNR